MTTFITKLDGKGSGPRVAVKDLVDVEGVATTAGCRALERVATAAKQDAACLKGFRAADARLVGKTNLHELAMLPIGTNPWFGTPRNPLDDSLIPGGSSSGSAVAVATGDADVAIGSDTGGSIRVPSACCGTTGLKTTHGRISLDGVWPLAPTLDTVGPMAATVSGLTLGMQMFEPGFTPTATPARVVGRVRTAGHPDDVGDDITATLAVADLFRPGVDDARRALKAWKQALFGLFDRVEVLALPTLPIFPPRIDEIGADNLMPIVIEITKHVALFNAAGTPCTAQPVPIARSSLPASLQLVAPLRGEELLLTTAQHLGTAVAA